MLARSPVDSLLRNPVWISPDLIVDNEKMLSTNAAHNLPTTCPHPCQLQLQKNLLGVRFVRRGAGSPTRARSAVTGLTYSDLWNRSLKAPQKPNKKPSTLFCIDCERSEPIAAEGRRLKWSGATWACPGIIEPKARKAWMPRRCALAHRK